MRCWKKICSSKISASERAVNLFFPQNLSAGKVLLFRFASEMQEQSFVLRRSMCQSGLTIFFSPQNLSASKVLLFRFANEMLEKALFFEDQCVRVGCKSFFSSKSKREQSPIVLLVRCRNKALFFEDQCVRAG